ncbi:MAG: AhpC/TSA family protein [Odoribacter sp.]|nr:AhpC/TSA family protein [Odoribacter sp.]
MKKTLFSLAAALVSLAACNTTPQYSVKGTVEGAETGNVYIVKQTADGIDTLAHAAVVNGKFAMTGSVENLTSAFVTIEGKRGATPIYLENAKYTATLSMENPMNNKIEGTATQNLANEYSAITNEVRKSQSELYKEYRAASEAKDEAKMKEIEERYEQAGKAGEEKEDAWMQANADTYIAAQMLASKMSGYEVEELKAKYELLGENAKATEPGQKIAERIQKLESVAIGKVAPDFTLNTPEGKPLSMHSIKGKVKVIDFWASWCGPCRGENPNVVKMYKELHPKGLEILSVSLDNNKEAWLKAIKDDNLTWNHVSDLKGWGSEAGQLYGVNGIPHLVVLDENNVIVAKNLRGDELRKKVAELLKKK